MHSVEYRCTPDISPFLQTISYPMSWPQPRRDSAADCIVKCFSNYKVTKSNYKVQVTKCSSSPAN